MKNLSFEIENTNQYFEESRKSHQLRNKDHTFDLTSLPIINMKRRHVRNVTYRTTKTLTTAVMFVSLFSLSNGTFFHKKKHHHHEPIAVYHGSPMSTVDNDEMYEHHYNPYELSDDDNDMSGCHCECPNNKYIKVEVPKTQVKYYPIDEKEMNGKKYGGDDKYDAGSRGSDANIFRPPHTEDHPPDDTDQPFKPQISQTLYKELEGLVDKISSEIPTGYGHHTKMPDNYKDDGGKPKPKYHPQPGSPSKHETEDEHERDKDQYDKYSTAGNKYDEGATQVYGGQKSYDGSHTHNEDSSKTFYTEGGHEYTTDPKIQYETTPSTAFDDESYGTTPYSYPGESTFSIPFEGVDSDASSKNQVKGKPPAVHLDRRFSPKRLVRKQYPSKRKKNSYLLVIKRTTPAPNTSIKFEQKRSAVKIKSEEWEDQIPSPTNLPPAVSTEASPDMTWVRERLKQIPHPHEDLKNNIRKAGKVKRISVRVTDEKASLPGMSVISSSISLSKIPEENLFQQMSASSHQIKTTLKTASNKKNKNKEQSSKAEANPTNGILKANVTVSKGKKSGNMISIKEQDTLEEDHEYDEEEYWGSKDEEYEYQGEEVYDENKANNINLASYYEDYTKGGTSGDTEEVVKSKTRSGKDVITGTTLKPSVVGAVQVSDVIRVSASTIGGFLVTRNPYNNLIDNQAKEIRNKS